MRISEEHDPESESHEGRPYTSVDQETVSFSTYGLAQSGKPPVSGFNLTSGSSPTLALSLQAFGIDLNAGPTPSPTAVETFNGHGAVSLTSSDIKGESMRTWLIVIVIELCCAGIGQAQTTNCTVTGYLFKPDGSPAVQAQVNAIRVVNNGSSFVLRPIVLRTDATGFTSFTAPRLSTVWIVATALRLTASGDMAIQIPDADSATLDVLAQSARPPVSGFNLTSGSNPTLALSLLDFGINLNAAPAPLSTTVESFNGRSGVVALTSSDISTALNFTPLDPGTVVGAVNASSAQIDDARLSLNVVRRNVANAFSAQQAFSNGLQLQGDLGISGDIVATGSYRFQFPGTSYSNAQWASAQTPGDAGAADVNLAIASSPNLGSVRNNVVTSWGYNNNGDGLRVVATEPSLNYRFESFYSPISGQEYMESHLQYQSTKGKILRPFGLQVDRNTDETSFQIQSNGFSYVGPDDTQYVKFQPHGVYFFNRTALASYVNNSGFIQQLNAAGNLFVNIAYLDGSDRINLGNGGTDVVVSGDLYVGGTGGFKLTNSGGAGLGLAASGGGGAFLTGTEVAAVPGPPAANGWKLYAKDDGAGKTQLCVEFSSGPPQCFAKQP